MITKTKKIKSSRQAIFFSTLIGVLILFVIGFLIFSNLKITQKRAELINRIETLKKEIEILEKKNQELRAGISQVSLEKEARERLGLKKPGEEVVVVLPPEESEKERPEEKSSWQKILEKLGF